MMSVLNHEDFEKAIKKGNEIKDKYNLKIRDGIIDIELESELRSMEKTLNFTFDECTRNSSKGGYFETPLWFLNVYSAYLESGCDFTSEKLTIANDKLSNDEYSDDEEFEGGLSERGFNEFEVKYCSFVRKFYFLHSSLVMFVLDGGVRFIKILDLKTSEPAEMDLICDEMTSMGMSALCALYFVKKGFVEEPEMSDRTKWLLERMVVGN